MSQSLSNQQFTKQLDNLKTSLCDIKSELDNPTSINENARPRVAVTLRQERAFCSEIDRFDTSPLPFPSDSDHCISGMAFQVQKDENGSVEGCSNVQRFFHFSDTATLRKLDRWLGQAHRLIKEISESTDNWPTAWPLAAGSSMADETQQIESSQCLWLDFLFEQVVSQQIGLISEPPNAPSQTSFQLEDGSLVSLLPKIESAVARVSEIHGDNSLDCDAEFKALHGGICDAKRMLEQGDCQGIPSGGREGSRCGCNSHDDLKTRLYNSYAAVFSAFSAASKECESPVAPELKPNEVFRLERVPLADRSRAPQLPKQCMHPEHQTLRTTPQTVVMRINDFIAASQNALDWVQDNLFEYFDRTPVSSYAVAKLVTAATGEDISDQTIRRNLAKAEKKLMLRVQVKNTAGCGELFTERSKTQPPAFLAESNGRRDLLTWIPDLKLLQRISRQIFVPKFHRARARSPRVPAFSISVDSLTK